MTPQDNLYETFRANEADAADLSEIALAYFHNAQDASPTEVLFGVGSDNSTYALKFVYQKQRLVQILPGPTLTAEAVGAIKSKIDVDLQQPTATRITTQVLFTHLEVDGWFRFRDVFQILPVPSGSPRGSRLFGGNPFLVQFRFRTSSESMLHTFRCEAQGRKIHLLLNALLETQLSRLPGSRFRWIRLPNSIDETTVTAYCQEMYTFPDSGKFEQGDSFAPIGSTPPLASIEPQDYYTRMRAINDPARVLEVPANLTSLLSNFDSSSPVDQDRFLRACFWFYHAQTVFRDSSSATFTALISAIEALIPSDRPIGACPICQRSVGKGSSRRLAEFLDQFAPASPKFQEARAKLYYEFRSRLAHGGALTFSDRGHFFAPLTPQAIEEDRLTAEVWQLVKLILVNWLHTRTPLLVSVFRG